MPKLGIWVLFAVCAVAGAQETNKSKEVFEKVCGSCHRPDRALATRRSKEQWQEMIDLMIAKGLKASDEELAVTTAYLAAQYGRVNVNRAAADEIAEVLGLDAKEAEAIVKFRKESG